MLEASVSHVSHGESKESMHRETVAREREEREGSVISVAESMSKKSGRNSVGSHSLQTHRELHSDERDLREDLERRAQQAALGENSAQRKLYLTEYDLEIQKLERRNSEYALIESRRELESQRRKLLEADQWADQAQRVHQEYYTRSCQEIEEMRRRCYEEEHGVSQQKVNEYSMQQDQESRTADQIRKLQDRLEFEDSNIFQDPDSPSSFGSAHFSHQALITPSSRKPCRESRLQRDTRRDKHIPGNVFDRQSARRVPEELHDDSRNLAASSGIQRREGIENSGSQKPLQPLPSPCFSGIAKDKSQDDSNRLKSVTHHAAGIGTCTQSGMINPSYPSSEMHLG